MIQKDGPPDRPAKSSQLNLTSTEPSEWMQKQLAAALEMQQELFDSLTEANCEWSARTKVEADLASEFAAKLAACRSPPEFMAAFQEWLTRRMALIAEDSRRFMSDCQKLIERGARLLPDAGKGGSA